MAKFDCSVGPLAINKMYLGSSGDIEPFVPATSSLFKVNGE